MLNLSHLTGASPWRRAASLGLAIAVVGAAPLFAQTSSGPATGAGTAGAGSSGAGGTGAAAGNNAAANNPGGGSLNNAGNAAQPGANQGQAQPGTNPGNPAATNPPQNQNPDRGNMNDPSRRGSVNNRDRFGNDRFNDRDRRDRDRDGDRDRDRRDRDRRDRDRKPNGLDNGLNNPLPGFFPDRGNGGYLPGDPSLPSNSSSRNINVGGSNPPSPMGGGNSDGSGSGSGGDSQQSGSSPQVMTSQADIGWELQEKDRRVWIAKVLEETPASDAGFRLGDLIVQVEKTDVTSAEGVEARLNVVRPGDPASITIDRGGKPMMMKLNLPVRPPQPAVTLSQEAQVLQRTNLSLIELARRQQIQHELLIKLIGEVEALRAELEARKVVTESR